MSHYKKSVLKYQIKPWKLKHLDRLFSSKWKKQKNKPSRAWTGVLLDPDVEEHAGAGAGADDDPVVGRLPQVVARLGVWAQHLWDRLWRKQSHGACFR